MRLGRQQEGAAGVTEVPSVYWVSLSDLRWTVNIKNERQTKNLLTMIYSINVLLKIII